MMDVFGGNGVTVPFLDVVAEEGLVLMGFGSPHMFFERVGEVLDQFLVDVLAEQMGCIKVSG
jgi:hypothetical protein